MAALEELPSIGTIDFYGLRTVTEQQVRQKLGIKEGQKLSFDWRDAAMNRIENVPTWCAS